MARWILSTVVSAVAIAWMALLIASASRAGVSEKVIVFTFLFALLVIMVHEFWLKER